MSTSKVSVAPAPAEEDGMWVAKVPSLMETLSPSAEAALKQRYDMMDKHMSEQHEQLQKLMEAQRVIEEQQAKALVLEPLSVLLIPV
jgi:hypothetical protein